MIILYFIIILIILINFYDSRCIENSVDPDLDLHCLQEN